MSNDAETTPVVSDAPVAPELPAGEDALRQALRAAVEEDLGPELEVDGDDGDGGVDAADGAMGGEGVADPVPATDPATTELSRETKASRRAEWKASMADRKTRAARRERLELEKAAEAARTERMLLEAIKGQREAPPGYIPRTALETDLWGTLHKELGLTPEQVAARQAEAQATDPQLARRVQELHEANERRWAELEKKDKELKQQSALQDRHQRITSDIRAFSGPAENGGAEEFPYWYKLPESLRTILAEREVLSRVVARERGENIEYNWIAVLDTLDEKARPIVEAFEKKSDESDQGQETRTRSSGRAKAPGRGNARAAAEPASRGPVTEEDLRKAMRQAIREDLEKR